MSDIKSLKQKEESLRHDNSAEDLMNEREKVGLGLLNNAREPGKRNVIELNDKDAKASIDPVDKLSNSKHNKSIDKFDNIKLIEDNIEGIISVFLETKTNREEAKAFKKQFDDRFDPMNKLVHLVDQFPAFSLFEYIIKKLY